MEFQKKIIFLENEFSFILHRFHAMGATCEFEVHLILAQKVSGDNLMPNISPAWTCFRMPRAKYNTPPYTLQLARIEMAAAISGLAIG